MDWRLGLDMGTDSIGWSVIRLANKKPIELLDMGVRIFSNGREPAGEGRIGDPLNTNRRTARQMRRQRDRRLRRKKTMLHYLIGIGYMPSDKPSRQNLAQKDPYKLRCEAISRVLTNEELARILMQMVGRRGFKSNRKEQLSTQDKEKAGMLSGIARLTSILGNKTLGQWMYEEKCKNGTVRFRSEVVNSRMDYTFYPSREMYEAEFEAIKRVQGDKHYDIDWDRVYRILFFQRPLKRPERGRCEFFPEEERGYRAFTSAHRFRILQDINNLKYFDENNQLVDIAEQFKPMLYELLNYQKSVSFDRIRAEISKVIGESFTSKFNLEDVKRSKLKGNETACDLRSEEFFGVQWDEIDWKTQDDLIEMMINEEDESKILSTLDLYGLSEIQKKNILTWPGPSGTVSLSSKFMRECSEIMQKDNIPYHDAVIKMGRHHSYKQKIERRSSLPYYGKVLSSLVTGGSSKPEDDEEICYGRIANPTVHIALNQLRKLANALSRRYCRPQEIILEVGRDLKIGRERKWELFQDQAKNQEKNEWIKNELLKLGLVQPSGEDIKKYRLWEELAPDGLSRRCPYCGKAISASQLLSDEIEIEHILPFSRTLLDSRDNTTVAHRVCNRIKKEQTPYEAFSNSPQGFDWRLITELSEKLPPRKRIKFTPQAMERFNEEEGGFIQRQLTDNAYIAKAAKNYLSVICDRDSIWTTSGMLTAKIRGEWGINTLLNSNHDTWYKNRTDHRHHALDAVVIGLCDRNIIAATARMNSNKGYHSIMVPDFPFSRSDIERKLKQVIVSIKADHGPEGKLYQETAMGLIRVMERISPKDLCEDDIENIVVKRIRDYVTVLCTEKGFKKAKIELREKYSYFIVFREKWVSTKPLLSLTTRDIDAIVDKELRERLLAYVISAGTSKKLADVLKDFSLDTGIKAVRFFPNGQVPLAISSCTNKAYLPADFYRVDVWAVAEAKRKIRYEGVFISRAEYYSGIAEHSSKHIRKPHPAAKWIMTLYKDDVIEVLNSGNKQLCKIAGYSTTQNKIDIRPIAATDSISGWMTGTMLDLTSPFWPRNCEGHYYKSINAIFSEYEVRKVTISIDGRVISR